MSYKQRQRFTEMVIANIRETICSDSLREEFRCRKKDFSRQRVLTFPRTIGTLLTGLKMSLQDRVNRFFTDLGEIDGTTTANAFLQARDKVRPEVFQRLTGDVRALFYDHFEDYGTIVRWKGRRLIAIDGSVLNMPDSPETREEFTVIDNKSGRPYVQALTSYLYDVLNGVILNADIGRIQAEKKFIFDHHERLLQPGDIILLDRVYSDYEVLARAQQADGDVIVRSPITGNFKAVEKFALDPTVEDQTVTLSRPSRQRQEGLGLPASLTVRLVKVYLETGEIEVLITTLLDRQQYPREEFQWVYHQRWNVETYIGQLKHHWDVERFSSGKVDRIKQDFYAAVFLTALAAVLAAEAEARLQVKMADRHTKYAYKLNKAVIGPALANNLISLLFDKTKSVGTIITSLHDQFLQAPVPIRSGRSFKRLEAPLRQQLRYQRYGKKTWC